MPTTRTRVAFDEAVIHALGTQGGTLVTGNYSPSRKCTAASKYRARPSGTSATPSSAQVVEVTVDKETGVVTVDRVWVAHDCGKALNRLTVEGQVQGSVSMGMGQAMSEEAAYFNGLVITADMLEYRAPGILDSPRSKLSLLKAPSPKGRSAPRKPAKARWRR